MASNNFIQSFNNEFSPKVAMFHPKCDSYITIPIKKYSGIHKVKNWQVSCGNIISEFKAKQTALEYINDVKRRWGNSLP